MRPSSWTVLAAKEPLNGIFGIPMGQELIALEPRIIRGSRAKGLLNLAVCVGVICVGFFVICRPQNYPNSVIQGWFFVISFGIFALVYIIEIFRPYVLRLDSYGLELHGGLKVPRKIAWRDIHEFYVRNARHGKTIGYSLKLRGEPGSPPRYSEKSLPNGWPLSIDNMVDLLNIYRLQVLAREANPAKQP